MKRKKGKKRIKVNRLRIVLVVVVVVLIVMAGFSIKNVVSLRNEQAQLKSTNAELKDKKAQLQEELKNVNDTNYIEEQARIQLKLIKPGEVLYVLNDDNNSDSNK